MIPASSTVQTVVPGGQTTQNSATQGKTDPVAGQSRASNGVSAAANVRAETTQAVDPSRQAGVAPRLRDQENAERSPRTGPAGDGPTGPTPAFEETPLQRAARVIFDPPEAMFDVAAEMDAELEAIDPDVPTNAPSLDPEAPTPTEPQQDARTDPRSDAEARREAARQAEAAFEEARRLEKAEDAAQIDLSR